MSREVRRVPPDWRHPVRRTRGGKICYQPLFDEVYDDAKREWDLSNAAWEAGTHPDLVGGATSKADCPTYADWNGGPPDPDYYRHRSWTAEEATAFQVYETVSEGTPVSPVFETRETLIDWLASPVPADDPYPDLSVQGMTRTQAERFAGAGSAPSFVLSTAGLQMGAKVA